MHNASIREVLQTRRSGHQACINVPSYRCTHDLRRRGYPSWLCGGEFREGASRMGTEPTLFAARGR